MALSITSNIPFTLTNMILLCSSELIDLDHLLTKPIYEKGRNPFQTHVLHKNWKYLLAISVIVLPFKHINVIALGLISHFLLDYIYVKLWERNILIP